MMFLLHLLTDAVDIGNTVLSGSGELWRDGIAPAGGALLIDTGVGALETLIG
jgi:hypothetical protein